jgi:hypothetical protein
MPWPRTLSPPAWLGLWLLLGLFFCGPAEAQWKWRDGRGQLQYSDMPPPMGTPEEDILQKPPVPVVPRPVLPLPNSSTPAAPVTPSPGGASGAAAAPPLVDPVLEARRKQLEQQEAAKRKADEALAAQQRARNCERAVAQLRTLDSGQRISRINAQGEREFLDDPTRAQEANLARQQIDANCR